VDNITDESCYTTSSFIIEVGTNSEYNEPSDWFVCDDISNDGSEIFDLSTKVTEISAGISNIEWADMVKELTDKSGKKGISGNDLKNLDPRLLSAKVFDPYFKKRTTVKEFIKGWSVIKIS
jgi:hypothetical protein